MGSNVSLKEHSHSENIDDLVAQRTNPLKSTIQMKRNKELRLKRIYHVNKPYLEDENYQKPAHPPISPANINSLPHQTTPNQIQPHNLALLAPITTPIKTTVSELRPRTMMTQVVTPLPPTALAINTPKLVKVDPPKILIPMSMGQTQVQLQQNPILTVSPIVLSKNSPTTTAQIVTKNLSTQPRAMLVTPITPIHTAGLIKSNQIKPIGVITKT